MPENSRAQPGRLPFTVIGGYLGAGKTSLLNHILANADGIRFAVLINDFGSVNIDAALITRHAGDTMELANGCICCSLSSGFAEVIGGIRDRADQFDHMIIEASGVSDPARIAEFGQMYGFPLDGIVVLADAEQVEASARDRFVGEAVRRQFERADLVLLNKTDLVSELEKARVLQWLTETASEAAIVETVGAQVPLPLLFALRYTAENVMIPLHHHADHHQTTDHATLFRSWALQHDKPISRPLFEQFARDLAKHALRAKGFVHLTQHPGQRFIFHLIGPRWTLIEDRSWDHATIKTMLVIISRREGSEVTTDKFNYDISFETPA